MTSQLCYSIDNEYLHHFALFTQRTPFEIYGSSDSMQAMRLLTSQLFLFGKTSSDHEFDMWHVIIEVMHQV